MQTNKNICFQDLEHEEALQDFEDFCRCVGAGVQVSCDWWKAEDSDLNTYL